MADILGFPHGSRPGDVYPQCVSEVDPNEGNGYSKTKSMLALPSTVAEVYVLDPPSAGPAKITPTEEMFHHMANFAQIGLATARKKNQDYAGNGDPFANFRNAEAIGVSLARGILVRKMDKMARVSNLITRPPAVANESIVETLIDDAIYSLLLAAYVTMHPDAAE